jgi:hypothetical protein
VIPVRDVLTPVVARVIRDAPLSAEKVAFAWRTVVGPALDRGTTVRYADGILHVTARDPQWQDEVRRGLAGIVPRLRQLLGADVLRDVQVDAGRDDRGVHQRPRQPRKG